MSIQALQPVIPYCQFRVAGRVAGGVGVQVQQHRTRVVVGAKADDVSFVVNSGQGVAGGVLDAPVRGEVECGPEVNADLGSELLGALGDRLLVQCVATFLARVARGLGRGAAAGHDGQDNSAQHSKAALHERWFSRLRRRCYCGCGSTKCFYQPGYRRSAKIAACSQVLGRGRCCLYVDRLGGEAYVRAVEGHIRNSGYSTSRSNSDDAHAAASLSVVRIVDDGSGQDRPCGDLESLQVAAQLADQAVTVDVARRPAWPASHSQQLALGSVISRDPTHNLRPTRPPQPLLFRNVLDAGLCADAP